MPTFALVGNPNCGKTTLFNALTGLRQKVGNYPGVTVERKEGTLDIPGVGTVGLIDLPGLYSLTPHSPDERIARDALMGYLGDTPRPDAVVNVVDASNLERNLYLTTQLLDLGVPVGIVVTMVDTAARRGVHIDTEALSRELGVPVLAAVPPRREGIPAIADLLKELATSPSVPVRRWSVPKDIEARIEPLAALIRRDHGLSDGVAFSEAVALLTLPEGPVGDAQTGRWSTAVRDRVCDDRAALDAEGADAATSVAEARYAEIGRVCTRAVRMTEAAPETLTDRLDRIFLHRVWGYVIFLGLMAMVFQAMFSWASYPADLIQMGVDGLGRAVAGRMPEGDLQDLIVSGVFGGVGNTIVFLPQILLMFLFLSLLEDTGYLARAAFLMDRLMSRVGLHGKSFIPLLSSYACAIPGIMATRTIDSPRARLLTILVAPLMSCSARLPVYALMIGAFLPDTMVAGVHVGRFAMGVSLPTLTLTLMYALGTVTAFGMAWLFNRTLLRGDPPTFLLEMPPYRLPSLRTVLFQMAERAGLFLKRAGTVILSISMVLWFLARFPEPAPGTSPAVRLEQSFAGQLGRAIEPAIRPLGFDWKIGVGLVSSFAAREVFVTAVGTIYNVDNETLEDEEKGTIAVGERMKAQRDPRTGRPVFTPLVAVCLMVFYVLAMQCMSTIAVVRRETNSWKWPLFQTAYMTGLAWLVTFLVRVVGLALGYEG